MLKKYLFPLLGLVIFCAGFLLAYQVFKPTQEITEVSSENVLTLLQGEGFLVSQSYVFQNTVEIEQSTGSVWKDIFWRQYVRAQAPMKVSSGVDLSKLDADDVIVAGDNVEIRLPDVSTYSVELIGQVELQNKQGLFKRVFDNDDGYNTALAELQREARAAAEEEVLRNEAREQAISEVSRLIRFLQPSKQISVSIN